MSMHINSQLASNLDGAYRLVQTLILRTKSGQVFTIEIGESLFSGSHLYGAKVTRAGETNQHLGGCHGASIQQVVDAAQRLVADAIADGSEAFTPAAHDTPTAATVGQAL